MGNLLRNALHYTEHGFIRLTLEPSGFVVEDSGVGIPEEKREAMFEPFVRGSETWRGPWPWPVAGATDLRKPGLERKPEHHGAQWLPFSCGAQPSQNLTLQSVVLLMQTTCFSAKMARCY